MMELESEKVSSENKEKYSVLTYCRSQLVRKTFTYIYNLREFSTIYKATSILTLNRAHEKLPFDITMKINKREDKVNFSVKSYTYGFKRSICEVSLQSGVTKNKFEILTMLPDGESFEVTKAFLLTNGEYVFSDILKIIFKFVCIECVLYSTIHTTALQHDDKKYTGFASGDTSTAIFKVNNQKYLVNKDLLCAKSKYFRTWYENNKQKDLMLCLPAIPQNVILIFINFLQHNDTFDLENIDIQQIFALFTIADKFDVTDLKTICEQSLKEYILLKADIIGQYHALEILRFAYNNCLQDLLKFAVDFVALNITSYSQVRYFSIITEQYPELRTLIQKAKISVRRAYADI